MININNMNNEHDNLHNIWKTISNNKNIHNEHTLLSDDNKKKNRTGRKFSIV